MRMYIGIITLLLFCQTTGGHMRLAWWTTVYPQSLYEAGIVEETDADAQAQKEENSAAAEEDHSSLQTGKSENSEQEEKEESNAQTEKTDVNVDGIEEKQEDPIQIKWKLAEWVGRLFAR